MPPKKQILFVGASGAVAQKILPHLSHTYSVIGLSRSHTTLRSYCSAYYTGDLLTENAQIFDKLFTAHTFDAIIWNVVRYFPKRLSETSREILHTEFDLGVALPTLCLQSALRHGFTHNKTFTLVSSQLAFGKKPLWGSYSITKRGQIILASYLNDELLEQGVSLKVLAPGRVPDTADTILYDACARAVENTDPEKILYTIHTDRWE